MPYLHNHFPSKAELKLPNLLIPNPPTCKGLQTFAQLTKCILGSPPIPFHRKSLCNFSIRFATLLGKGRRERKYVSKDESELLMSVTLPPLNRYILFQPANLLSILSRIGFQTDKFLNFAPNGRPKYFKGREDCPHPNRPTKASKLCTPPTGTNSDFPKLIRSPDTSSNLARIALNRTQFIDLLSWKGKFGQHSSSVIWDVVLRLLWSIRRERGMRFSVGWIYLIELKSIFLRSLHDWILVSMNMEKPPAWCLTWIQLIHG